MTSHVVALTFLVSQPLSANGRLHWAKKADRTRVIRLLARQAWVSAGGPMLDRAHCVATVQHRDRRRRDAANAHPTVKAAIDGAVAAGLLPDDDDAHLIGPDLRTHPDPDPALPKGAVRITLTFTPQEEDC